MKNKKGFTLAEVLITLSIIGVIAAILFPSILANYNERTLKAKRQALVGRMSQAMGEMADTFRNYTDISCTSASNLATCTDNGSALKFINEGLSKVYKIQAACDNDSLSACDIPDEITRINGTPYSLKEATTFTKFNPQMTISESLMPYDTKSAAFMTKNGESILLFYNPNCRSKIDFTQRAMYTETMVCVNMVYDLNGGKKKPNKMGEDIGYMSVFYSDSPVLAAPRPYDYRAVANYDTTTDSSGTETYIGKAGNFAYSKAACEALGDNVGLPSKEEAMAIQVNRDLAQTLDEQEISGYFWTSTMSKPNYAWIVWLCNRQTCPTPSNGNNPLHIRLYNIPNSNAEQRIIRCVYKD